MLDLFIKIADQLNGSIVVLMLILIIAFLAIFKLGKVISQYDGFCKKQDKFDNSIDVIKEDIHSIKARVDIIYNRHLDTVKAHSSISITEIGKEISSANKLENLVTKYWEKISEKIKEKNPSNPYDIQTVSMNLASEIFEDIFEDEEKTVIKKYAFDSGRNLLEIYPIIGVIVRDRYLKEVGASLDEVDKHDPKVKTDAKAEK